MLVDFYGKLVGKSTTLPWIRWSFYINVEKLEKENRGHYMTPTQTFHTTIVQLVVSTHLKNISQIGSFPKDRGENKKNMFETTTQLCMVKNPQNSLYFTTF